MIYYLCRDGNASSGSHIILTTQNACHLFKGETMRIEGLYMQGLYYAPIEKRFLGHTNPKPKSDPKLSSMPEPEQMYLKPYK